MAVIPVINPTLAGVAYVKTTASAGLVDTFVAQRGATYLVNIECGATANTIKFDDPNSVAPAGATTFDADMSVSVGVSTNKTVRLAANRFLNSATGNVTLTALNNTTTTYTVFGPL